MPVRLCAVVGAVSVAVLLLLSLVARTRAQIVPLSSPQGQESADPADRAAGALQGSVPLANGKFITPVGTQTGVASFPANMVLTPDGKYLIVTDTGYRQQLSVLDSADGSLVSRLSVGLPGSANKDGLYYGLAFGPDGTLFVSRGAQDKVACYTIGADGSIAQKPNMLSDPPSDPKWPNVLAGLAIGSDGKMLYAARNNTGKFSNMKGGLTVLDTATGSPSATIPLPGFSFGVAAVTIGPDADKKVYVTSERDGLVSIVDPSKSKWIRDIRVGASPTAVLLDKAQRHLYIANSGSDTVSILDTRADKVTSTILLRPDNVRGLPGATPLGMALSPDEKRLYVAVADMNAVGVVDLRIGAVVGYIPAGWYPTAVVESRDGKRLFVANAKGTQVRNPNNRNVLDRGKYVLSILEGSVACIPVPEKATLEAMTAQVLTNNLVASVRPGAAGQTGPASPIDHVIYVIKENRTYDQVLGDIPRGNGDETQCLFPRSVTPNQHALAERFVLLDNFYCCADVSADGWNWSTAGMANEYAARNAPYNYSGRGRVYDYEGQNNGVAVDLIGLSDVAMPPGRYIWDNCVRHRISIRNYGFFEAFDDPAAQGRAARGGSGPQIVPNKAALTNVTDLNYRLFDLTYADSDAYDKHYLRYPARQKHFGANRAASRFAEWKQEFDAYVKQRTLPRFLMVRLGDDHTAGTSTGYPSPRSMVADNDYAVGQLVEAVSHSPYWSRTAIFIVEDDAQAGNDHVDAHRSTAYVISPYIRAATVDSHFYNTDSVLRTMERILGLPPMCQYDAIATAFPFIGTTAVNHAPYAAILPDRSILAETNLKTAYRARESNRLNFKDPDAVPDHVLTDIVWHAVKGRTAPLPTARHNLTAGLRRAADDD